MLYTLRSCGGTRTGVVPSCVGPKIYVRTYVRTVVRTELSQVHKTASKLCEY